MATRVLNTIRERDKIVGFRIICSLKDCSGIHILGLSKAAVFYKTIECFENVKYLGRNQWEGIECSLDKFPSMDRTGRWIKGKEHWFILGRMFDEGELVGFKLMDINGDVYYNTVENTIQLGLNDGFINAKLVSKENSMDYNISALRGKFREFEVKDNVRPLLGLGPKKNSLLINQFPKKEKGNLKEISPDLLRNTKNGLINPNITEINKIEKINKYIDKIDVKDGVRVLDEEIKKDRYLELSQMFAKKEKGEITDGDIARKVGAITSKEYSQKIHEYLGEPLSLSDRDILGKLYKVYKASQINQNSASIVKSVPTSDMGKDENPDIARMRKLIDELTKAAEVYYSGEDEIMSNYEYDALYDELEKLEKKTGVILNGSLTQKVGFEIRSKLPKVKHPSKMLSLDKTKDRNDLANSVGGQPSFLGWKLDGCFNENTKITMSDGSLKRIKDIQVGDMVLSYDLYNRCLVTAPVVNKFKNGFKKLSSWTRLHLNSLSDTDSLTATCNHLFFTNSGWVEAGKLKAGSTIYVNDYKLTESQISFIVGASLGDGSIISRNTVDNKDLFYKGLEFRYSKVSTFEYMDLMYKFENLFQNHLGNARQHISGYGSEMYTRFLNVLYNLPKELRLKENFYKTSLRINLHTLKYLTPLALAIYYIDDGNKTNNKIDGYVAKNKRARVQFSMYRYSLSEIELFCDYLLEKYNLYAKPRLERKLKDGSDGYVVDLSADSTEDFFDLIAPYIPKSIRPLKLSNLSRWQDIPEIPWWQDIDEIGLIEREVLSVEHLKDDVYSSGKSKGYMSYDLEVEGTHTYFAKGCLVHNCTVAFTYENGELVSAVTRGDGVTGEEITHNAKFFKGVPMKINYTDRLVVRGEALISRKRFDEINAKITNVDDKYKNARNLASGSIRQLDSKIAKERGVEVVAFSVYEGFDNLENYSDKLDELRKYGFDVVPFIRVKTKEDILKGIEYFEGKVQSYKFPTDGLVITIDNIAYGEMLGTTAKYPRNSKAFKWKDEVYETPMVDVEWSVGRTGAITPVAIFKPTDIDGTTITRASVHNVSIFKQLKLGKGDKVEIFKANMIIPQISKNNTMSGTFQIPDTCPICGKPTQIIKSKDAEVLICTNADCPAQHLGALSHFVSRDCMNIEGLSDATLEEFVNQGFIKDFKDIYHLNDYENDIIKLDGFGKGSYNKLWKAIEKSRECELPAFISALGIAQMGKTTSKDVCKALDYDLEKLMGMSFDELQGISGVGAKTAKEIVEYFKENKSMVVELAQEMHFKTMPKIDRNSPIAGLTFCITGDVYTFKNRKELQAKIESLGAKASSSVSAKTSYLINNDVTSTSNKNQTAKKLGIPIISEADFLKMIGE